MSIFIKLITGKFLTLEVECSDTVEKIKNIIYELEGFCVE